MGVEFLVCTGCRRTFPDCGPFSECKEDWGGCGRTYCSEKCSRLARPGHDRPPTWQEVEALYETDREAWKALRITCVDCRGELPNDKNVLAFLLRRTGMTRAEADAAYLSEMAIKKEDLEKMSTEELFPQGDG